MPLKEENLLHLLKILIKKEQRGQGVAEKLIFQVFHQYPKDYVKLILEVATDNHSAVAFYRKIGAQPLNIVKRFYSDGKDALRMELSLPHQD